MDLPKTQMAVVQQEPFVVRLFRKTKEGDPGYGTPEILGISLDGERLALSNMHFVDASEYGVRERQVLLARQVLGRLQSGCEDPMYEISAALSRMAELETEQR